MVALYQWMKSTHSSSQSASCYQVLDSLAPLSDSLLQWELPRFGLKFQNDPRGTLMSQDYTGYRLANNQQLASNSSGWYTLPEFQQYLVLERCEELLGSHNSSCARRPDLLILLPVGEVRAVTDSGHGSVRVAVPAACGAKVKVGGAGRGIMAFEDTNV